MTIKLNQRSPTQVINQIFLLNELYILQLPIVLTKAIFLILLYINYPYILYIKFILLIVFIYVQSVYHKKSHPLMMTYHCISTYVCPKQSEYRD